MKKITRRNFLIASGKTVGTLAAASAFMPARSRRRTASPGLQCPSGPMTA